MQTMRKRQTNPLCPGGRGKKADLTFYSLGDLRLPPLPEDTNAETLSSLLVNHLTNRDVSDVLGVTRGRQAGKHEAEQHEPANAGHGDAGVISHPHIVWAARTMRSSLLSRRSSRIAGRFRGQAASDAVPTSRLFAASRVAPASRRPTSQGRRSQPARSGRRRWHRRAS